MDKQWLEGEVEKACRNAQKHGLSGNRFNVELFTTGGRIYDGSITLVDLSTKQHIGAEYPNLQVPGIIRITDGNHMQAYEVGITANPEGVIVKRTEGMVPAIA
jgi:hypothetical protein